MSHSHEADDVVAVIAVVDGGKMSTTTVYTYVCTGTMYMCTGTIDIYMYWYYLYCGGWRENEHHHGLYACTGTMYVYLYWYYVCINVLVLYIYVSWYFVYGGGWREMSITMDICNVCMYECMYLYIKTRAHTHTHTHIHTHTYTQLLSSGDTSFEETRTNCKPALATSFVLASPSKEQSYTRSSSLHKQPSEVPRRDGYTQRATEGESAFPAGSKLHGLPVFFFSKSVHSDCKAQLY
jgi:hypothetical protein